MRVNTICAIIVAIATPSTPVPNPKIKRQFKAIFVRVDITIATKGVVLSPNDLSMPAHKLYEMVVIKPPKIMYP